MLSCPQCGALEFHAEGMAEGVFTVMLSSREEGYYYELRRVNHLDQEMDIHHIYCPECGWNFCLKRELSAK